MKQANKGSSQFFSAAFALSNASLCSTAIALWGWQTNLLFIALPMILLLEARHIIRQRWTLSLKDIKEVAKFCVVILLAVFVVVVITQKSLFIYTLLQWLPVSAFPLVMVQTYGIGVLEQLRDEFSNPHLLKRGVRRKENPINLHYLYFALCILAASAADSEGYRFYVVTILATALFLWTLRPKRSAPVLWLLMFCLSAGLGFAGHLQISHFQRQLQAQVYAMLGSLATGSIDPTSSATQMGSVGRLKLSNRIVFRVDAPATAQSSTFPLLLREATYNQYQLSTWTADNSIFQDVPPGENEGDWILAKSVPQSSSVTISTNLERGKEVLTLPQGTSKIIKLPVEEMQQNQYGAVQVDAVGDFAYEVEFGAAEGVLSLEAPPMAIDVQVPKVDMAAIEKTLADLEIEGMSALEKVSAIAHHFQTFKYSLDLLRPKANTAPVSDFLLNTQAGHCEYFASATALLLRGAGIPARYAVGYAAHEFSNLEQQYVVRSRDAHAWTLVYLGSKWQILDTTPADWTAQEQAMTSAFQIVPDLFAFVGFQISYRIRQLGELSVVEVILLMTPVFGYLIWRSSQQFKAQKANQLAAVIEDTRPTQYGLDSEFYLIEQRLDGVGLGRSPSESLLQWKLRLSSQFETSQAATLTEILALHYRYRFDPNSLSAAERAQLKTLTHRWIDEFNPVATP